MLYEVITARRMAWVLVGESPAQPWVLQPDTAPRGPVLLETGARRLEPRRQHRVCRDVRRGG